MSEHIYVKPVNGKLVRDEYTLGVIPPGGALVKRTRHVERRIREGDLEQSEAPEPGAADAPVQEDAQATTDRPRRRGKHESEG